MATCKDANSVQMIVERIDEANAALDAAIAAHPPSPPAPKEPERKTIKSEVQVMIDAILKRPRL